jgi:hypothetical protein
VIVMGCVLGNASKQIEPLPTLSGNSWPARFALADVTPVASMTVVSRRVAESRIERAAEHACDAAGFALTNLAYNLARYEQIVRLKLDDWHRCGRPAGMSASAA